jgi:1-aminocyclopropane-1-carboxylate deaminase/D-cysteine desulfhydrase
VTDAFNAVAARPRVALAHLPTPLQHAPRLSDELGIDLWIKRDDVGSLGLAGNKVRKLEFTFGEACANGATAVVTLGAPQSNHARATAAAAAQLGMPAVLVMRGDDPGGSPGGNLLLDGLFGAEVRYAGTDDWAALAELTEAVAGELEASGERPFTMPAGASSPVGALGFVAAYEELLEQLDEQGLDPQRVYHASTSGGTHAGLCLGHALAGRGPRPRGFDVGRIVPDPAEYVRWLAAEAAALLGAVAAIEPDLDPSQLGERYGAFTPAATEAIRLTARREGIALDPVYSGKGMAGLIADARSGNVEGSVVFWHTGGGPSLFAPGWAEPLL